LVGQTHKESEGTTETPNRSTYSKEESRLRKRRHRS
jgi:hypothetical protein